MKELIISPPNEKQKLFFECQNRFIGYGGARGGGKSWALRTKFILLALEYSGLKLLLLRKTLPELRENHLLPMLAQLNGIALDLRDRAYEQYGDEGDKLFKDVTLLRSLDGDDYEKYLDELERYYKDGEYLLERLTTMSDAEYEKFLQTVDAWENDRDFAFKEYTDALDREEFERELAFKMAEAERDQANEDRDYQLALQRLYNNSDKSDKDKTKDADDTINYPETYKEFCTATGFTGIMTETEYLAHNEVAKKYGTYKKYLKAMYKIYK